MAVELYGTKYGDSSKLYGVLRGGTNAKGHKEIKIGQSEKSLYKLISSKITTNYSS